MDIEPGTSSEADKDLAALGDGWTKSLKFIPGFSYKKLEGHLVLEAKKTPDGKPAEALKHKKSGYKLFKAGYPRQIMVKPNVKKGNEAVHFVVQCHVNAEMKKKQYLVYVHLHQHSGDIAYAKCYCPDGAGRCCKHVAATLYQLLDYIELGLSDIPDDKTCTQELQKWHVPRKNTTQAALLFEDLIFPQDSYDKDKKGRKRPIPEGKREDYCSTREKVSKDDLEWLKTSLEKAGSTCHLVGILGNTNCEPCEFTANELPSRQRIMKAAEVGDKLDQTAVRSSILKKLTQNLDCTCVPDKENCEKYIMEKLFVNNEGCREIEKNMCKQNECEEWYKQRKCRLTSSLFGCVVKRRKTIYPKTIVNKITKPSQIKNASCQWGIENEQKALIKYHEYKDEINEHVALCSACGLVVNPMWPWLGASPDALILDKREESMYGAVEVKCPASKSGMSIINACSDKSFCLEIVNGKPCLKKNHVYYYQVQGVMAICQLCFVDFVVYTVSDVHVERIYFSKVEWEKCTLPELTTFYFNYLMPDTVTVL